MGLACLSLPPRRASRVSRLPQRLGFMVLSTVWACEIFGVVRVSPPPPPPLGAWSASRVGHTPPGPGAAPRLRPRGTARPRNSPSRPPARPGAGAEGPRGEPAPPRACRACVLRTNVPGPRIDRWTRFRTAAGPGCIDSWRTRKRPRDEPGLGPRAGKRAPTYPPARSLPARPVGDRGMQGRAGRPMALVMGGAARCGGGAASTRRRRSASCTRNAPPK